MGLVENQSLSTIDIDREFVDDVDHLSPINFVNYDRIGSIIVSNNITFNINGKIISSLFGNISNQQNIIPIKL